MHAGEQHRGVWPGVGDSVAMGVQDFSINWWVRSRRNHRWRWPALTAAGSRPRSWLVSWRRSSLVNPFSWVRNVSSARAGRGCVPPDRQAEGIRLPAGAMTGSVTAWRAWARARIMAEALVAEQASVGGEADLPQGGQIHTRPLLMPRSSGLLRLVTVRSALPSLWSGFTLACFYSACSEGVTPSVMPGPKEGPGGAFSAVVDAPVEDQPDLIGAADVEVVPDHVFEEHPASDRGVEHLGEG